MMYKFVNKRQVDVAPNPIRQNGKVCSNPTKKTLARLGYKDLLVQDVPEVPEGKMAMPVYTDGEVITQSWEIVDDVES